MTAVISGSIRSEVAASREDPFVRGLAEAVGGPLGDHAASPRRRERVLSPALIILVVAGLFLALGWIQKSSCSYANNEQYKGFCYSDVYVLYNYEGVNEGKVPYIEHPVEYPVLIGYLMAAIGLPAHDLSLQRPEFDPQTAFYNINAVVLLSFGMAAIAITLALRRRRPWDALLFALAPALFVTATVNWDLLAVGLTAMFLYAWAKERPVVAGILLGLATSAKLYPLFLVGPLVVLALRAGRARAWWSTAVTVVTGLVTWLLVNAYPFLYGREGWLRFWTFNNERPVDWGTFWYIGKEWPSLSGEGPNGVQWFIDRAQDIPSVNLLAYVFFGIGCVGVAVLTILAPRRPRVAQLCFLVVALFLLTAKVWSQQFVLWLIPLAVLARPKWGAFLVWQFCEIAYFLGFYGHLLNLGGVDVFPEATYVYIATLRWWGLVMLCGFVVWDILRPRRDAVWETYGDDPDGGPFVGATDAQWVQRLRSWLPTALPAVAGTLRARAGRVLTGRAGAASVDQEHHDVGVDLPGQS